jgi:uncharacterized protein with HEPN domain
LRDPRLYVDDILEAISRIESYVDGLGFDEFSRGSGAVALDGGVFNKLLYLSI